MLEHAAVSPWPLSGQPLHQRDAAPWRRIPAWADLDEATFRDAGWQLRSSVRSLDGLAALVGALAPDGFLEDVRAGLAAAPMAMRITPHLLASVVWSNPWRDPIRRQFIPVGSELEADHPMGSLDSLEEERDAVLPGLVHRYPDKVLYLTLDVCPVYCRFCTRSYAVGADTQEVEKASLAGGRGRLDQVLAYLRAHPQVVDVVVSGGDTSMLPASGIREIGEALVRLPQIRRVRFASKLMSVLPQKVLSDQAWLDALTEVTRLGRERGCEVALHTHINHPAEITVHTLEAAKVLWQRGITVRNQSVLQRGVNDTPEVMSHLLRELASLHLRPYYVYTHDVVAGVEVLRTSLRTALEVEKAVRGSIAGFDMPVFVCDVVGGGGKRDAHSFEHYDERMGVAVFRSPVVDPERPFFYFDPLSSLSPEARSIWSDPERRGAMLQRILERAGMGVRQ
ncbi:MAG: KamA family radical SAM protein [Deltaproteobacteria bacterium]|nr:KamA family radical SAM protein [Deltaproteobacteria bacterium]